MKEAKRRQIMVAAERLFSRGRFHEITMEEVAHEAGVGKGTLYRYFTDKDDLFFQVMLSGYEELAELVRTERERASCFSECLRSVCGRISEFYRARHQLMHMIPAGARRSLWQRDGRRDELSARRRMLVAAIGAILGEGQREGLVRADLAPEVLATFLLSALQSRGRIHRKGGNGALGCDTVVELFLHGAAANHGATES